MSYTLDGIETAMTLQGYYARCPCGAKWWAGERRDSFAGLTTLYEDKESLRFHYANCRRARKPVRLAPPVNPSEARLWR